MKHVPVTISDTAQPVPLHDAGVVLADAYDPARERAVARRLRGARWRRLALIVTAISISAAAAASFTLMNRDMIQAELTPAPVVAAPAAEAPALASSTSRPVHLPGTGADPNKAQARVIVPADPEPQPVRPPVTEATAPVSPASETLAASAPRSISLSPASPVRGDAVQPASPAGLPAAALGFAPVPAPRPTRAP